MNKIFSVLVSFFFVLLVVSFTSAQNNSFFSHPSDKKNWFSNWSRSKKASIMSAVLPGLGQIYNKKIWKVPIIYGVGGWLTFNIFKQNEQYHYYKTELINVINGGINKDGLSSQQLTLLKNQSKKWRDLSIGGLALVYVLNILDANVDAHLREFDISDNLSLQLSPYFSPQQSAILLTLTF